jgi:hypothetical protein
LTNYDASQNAILHCYLKWVSVVSHWYAMIKWFKRICDTEKSDVIWESLSGIYLVDESGRSQLSPTL